MVFYKLDPSATRAVDISGLTVYTYPVPHPDRNMDVHAMFYLIDGQITVIQNGEEYCANPGDVVFLPAYHHHYGRKLYQANTRVYYVHFETKSGDQDIRDKNPAFSEEMIIPVWQHINNPAIVDYFQSLVRSYVSHSPYKGIRCTAFLYLLLTGLSDDYKQKDVKKNPIIEDVLAFLESHPQKFYTISELAKYAGLSPRSLTSHFREITGQSIHKYQMDHKLDHIALLLPSHSYPNLKSISLNFGFYDEFHLITAFKKRFGISPAKYGRKPGHTRSS
jgi:AraC-like DNA-binding protein